MPTIPKPDDRELWLEARRPYFNASDAGALYGCHPHRSLADVAVDKLKPQPPDEPTDAMKRGVALEPALLAWMGDELGAHVVTPDVLFIESRMMATLDGIVVGTDDLVEAKSTSYRWDETPEHVFWQVCAQLAASGMARAHVVWLDSSMRIQHELVVPTPEDRADVLERAASFMAAIDLGMVPDDVELGASHVSALYPEPQPGKYVDLSDDGLQAIVHWEQARQARLAAQKYEDAAKDEVARRLMDAEGARYDGRLVLNWKANKPSEKVDWKALEAAHPDLVAEFRRTMPGARVLRATRELSEVA